MKNWLKKILKENSEDLTKKSEKVITKAIKSGLDEVKKEISPEFVEQLVQNIYSTLNNPKIANKISDIVSSIDGDKIDNVLQQFTEPFTTKEGSLQLSRSLKQLQHTGQLDDMINKLTDGTENLGMPQKFAVKILMSALEPILKNVDSTSEEELAKEIRDSFNDLPTKDISDMIETLGRSITPETIATIKRQATKKLPAPKTLANIFSDIIEAGRKRAENVLSENKTVTGSLKDDISKIVNDNMKKDAAKKNNFGVVGHSFKHRPPSGKQ